MNLTSKGPADLQATNRLVKNLMEETVQENERLSQPTVVARDVSRGTKFCFKAYKTSASMMTFVGNVTLTKENDSVFDEASVNW